MDKDTGYSSGRYIAHQGQTHDAAWAGPEYPDGNVTIGPTCKPCLFNVQTDPEERHDLATEQPQLLAKLAAELGNQTHFQTGAGADRFLGDYTKCVSMSEFTATHKGFLGPLCSKGPPLPPPPPPPSPPPGPPATPAELAGRYAPDAESAAEWEISVSGAASGLVSLSSEGGGGGGSTTLSLRNIGCGSCCWKSGNGTVQGGVITASASGGGCARDVMGAVTTTAKGMVSIKWDCKKADGSYCAWQQWDKIIHT